MKFKDSYGDILNRQCLDKENSKRYLKSYDECPILPKKCSHWECSLSEEIPFKYRRGFKNTILEIKRLNGDYNFKGIALPCIAMDEGKSPEEAYKLGSKYLDSSGQATWVLFQIYNLSAQGEKFKEWFNTKHNGDPKEDGLVSMCQFPLTYWKKNEKPHVEYGIVKE